MLDCVFGGQPGLMMASVRGIITFVRRTRVAWGYPPAGGFSEGAVGRTARRMRLELDAGDVHGLTVSLYSLGEVLQQLANSYPKGPDYLESAELLEGAAVVCETTARRLSRHVQNPTEDWTIFDEKES